MSTGEKTQADARITTFFKGSLQKLKIIVRICVVQHSFSCTIFCVMMTTSERSARGPNSIKFIEYLGLLHGDNAAQQYATCLSSLLRWQFSRLRPQQTSDLLAHRTNGSKHRGGFKVVCDIRFLLPPCSRPLTFQNKQIPSSGLESKVGEVGL